MRQTFDTYNKRSTVYKLTEISALLFLALLIPIGILQNRLNTILSSFWNRILLATFVLSLICFIAGLFIRTVRSNILMYVKDGDLELDIDKFKLGDKTYNLSDINRIEFKVIGYRGQTGSRSGKDGIGNKIKIFEKSSEIIEKAFVINTREELDNLKDILMQWRQTGFEIKANGFDLR